MRLLPIYFLEILERHTWLDAQHRHGATVQRAPQRTAPHAEAGMADTAAVTHRPPTIRPHLLTLHREAVEAHGAAAAGLAAAQNRAGREPVLLNFTRLRKCVL